MNHSEHIIAIVYRVNNYSDGIYVVNFVKCLSLKIHFAVNSVYRLDPAVDVEIFKVKLGQAFLYLFDYIVYKLGSLGLALVQIAEDFGIGHRVKLADTKVLKFFLYPSDTEAVGNGSINLKRFLEMSSRF